MSNIEDSNIERIVDEEAGVICYKYMGHQKAGLACVPITQTDLKSEIILTEDDIIEYINDYTVLINRDLSTYDYDVLKIIHEDKVHLARLCDSNGKLSTVEIETVE